VVHVAAVVAAECLDVTRGVGGGSVLVAVGEVELSRLGDGMGLGFGGGE